jgi:SH3-like domain-containing protein
MWKCLSFISLLLLAPTLSMAKSPLPDVPDSMSLKNAPCNVRVGPGRHFPIRWVFQRANMPVLILQKFQDWFKIKDMDDAVGWIHKSMLSRKTYGIFKLATTELRQKPFADCKVIARVKHGVLARIKTCEDKWCQVSLTGVQGSPSGYVIESALWPRR